MSCDPYYAMCLQVQAARRWTEGKRSPIGEALGVAAAVYPHQVGNVLRVLTDVRVRHLLADEVGLGKTVQALMILNALRGQRRNLRVLVIVPDQLVTQWRDEIMTRAHSTPIGESGGLEGNQYIRLAWEAQLRREKEGVEAEFRLSDIDPDEFDVLVVDELHRLRSDLQDRIVRAAPDFQHVLVLTATPAFQQPARHAQLFAILEPQRARKAKRRIASEPRGFEAELSESDDLSSWPDWAAREVVTDLLGLDKDAATRVEESNGEAIALTYCAYRRVIRTRRSDFESILPQRSHRPIAVRPIAAEVERQELMWEYFSHLDQLTRRFDPVLLAKRVVLSPPSLEQRVDFLRRNDHDRGDLLARVKPLVHKRQGDSRVDALLDLLMALWDLNPDERVLVAAQDNLTVDYLYDLIHRRLPVIGPLEARRPLVVARIRQGMMTEAVEDLAGAGNETYENLEAFQRGEAQLLLAPEVAQVGLNLQCARVLVLYSVPWRPEQVEQWIGRLDRIGNSAIETSGDPTISVYTIAQDGLVDQKVVKVLENFRVFERTVNLDGEHLDEVADLIEKAALDTDAFDWGGLEMATASMAAGDAGQELKSELQTLLPWGADVALAAHKTISELPALGPTVGEVRGPPVGPESWDRAFEATVALLKAAEEYHIRWNTDPTNGARFQTLWYRFGDRDIYGGRHVEAKVVFSFGADPSSERHPRHAHAFFTRRGDLGNPPERHVSLALENETVRRPRRFLSHGDPLHDELVDGWRPATHETHSLEVVFQSDLDFWAVVSPGYYLLRVAEMDPAALLPPSVRKAAAEGLISSAVNARPENRAALLAPFIRSLNAAFEADIRWLRSLLRADLQVEMSQLVGSRWISVPDGVTSMLLDPLRWRRATRPVGRATGVSEELNESAAVEFERLSERSARDARQLWANREPALAAALATRLFIVGQEREDAIREAVADLERASRAVESAEGSGQPSLITRSRNQLGLAEDRVALTKQLWAERTSWLESCDTFRELVPRDVLTVLLSARRG